ncbi:hypothetical protein GCM10010232_70760 [Streptomyces amakusaensis]|uniref:DUF2637 domain-containing protein n=1 Tax=Streptomyces amakusaensis TaxID=67271 RepID=A0ABW0ATL7_9ACTN
MSRKKLEAAGPPGSAARMRVELVAADQFISFMTWGVAAGMIVWSMLNATPYVREHLAPGWENTAFVLPLMVDLAFVGALRADEIASRYGISGGRWAAALRLFTGAASVFLNVGSSAEKHDWTGVAQHLVAPVVLVLVAEAGPAYRRRLTARLEETELEEAAKATAARQVEEQEAERRRRQQREEEERRRQQQRDDADRKAAQERADSDRERRQRRDDELFALDLEEKRESARAARAAAHNRADGTTAHRHDGTTAPVPAPQPRPAAGAPVATGHAPAAPVRVPVALVASTPHTGVPAPQARTGADNRPAVAPTADPGATAADNPTTAPVPPRTDRSAAFARVAEPAAAAPRQPAPAAVSAAATNPARVTARVDERQEDEAATPAHSQIWERPAPVPAAGPVKDWDLPGLPADCAPGRKPDLLTETQAHARIRYGHANGWAQRRVATFAGRSPSTVHKHMKALDVQ